MSKVSDSNKMVLCHFFKYCNLLKPISPSIIYSLIDSYNLYVILYSILYDSFCKTNSYEILHSARNNTLDRYW